jgi:hypothetical protein
LKPKLYVAGLPSTIPPLPRYSTAWNVHEHFNVFHNAHGRGCHMQGAFTLLPRSWIKHCFLTTLEFFDAFKKIVKAHPRLDPRGDGKVPVYEPEAPNTYFTCGVAPKRFGKDLITVGRKLTKQKRMMTPTQLLHKYMRKATHAALGYMDSESIAFARIFKALSNLPAFQLGDHEIDPQSIWTAIAIAINVAMESHDDKDFYMGLVGVLGAKGYHANDESPESVLQYFCFPSIGSAVALRNGDLLLINPLLPHCISSRATKDEDVICTSLYLKTALVGGNNNDRSVDDIPNINEIA